MWLTEKKFEDPADQAFDLLQTHAALERMIGEKVKALIAALEKAKVTADGHAKFGGQHIAALDLIRLDPLRAAKDLLKMAQMVVDEIDDLKESSQGGGEVVEVLNQGCSKEAFEANISKEIKAGKSKEQAVAIAYSTLKKACGVTSDRKMSVDEILKGGTKAAADFRDVTEVVRSALHASECPRR